MVIFAMSTVGSNGSNERNSTSTLGDLTSGAPPGSWRSTSRKATLPDKTRVGALSFALAKVSLRAVSSRAARTSTAGSPGI